MQGIIKVDVPDGCQNCDFFQLVMNTPLLIKRGYDLEDVKGACRCILIKDCKRLKPLDNGEILIETPVPTVSLEYNEDLGEFVERKSVHYETDTYKGRPFWCPIKTNEWQ